MDQSFQLGAIRLSNSWRPMLHSKIKALDFPPVEGIDCAQCRMVRARVFPAHVKCCSRTPELPNFLVGALLENSGDTQGTRVVRDWVKGTRNTPLFVPVPPAQRRYEAKLHSFEEWPLCPMYDNGLCTIYEYRPFICAGYHCAFPSPPELYAFWNSLSTLLALLTANASQYIALQVGLDRDQFRAAWADVGSEDEVWEGEALHPEFHEKLWHGHDPQTFYKACHQYILDHKDTIRQELDQFRRNQLLERLRLEGKLTPKREQEIQEQPKEPAPLRTNEHDHSLYMKELVVNFEKNLWTLHEVESHILWYHEQVWGSSQTSEPHAESASMSLSK